MREATDEDGVVRITNELGITQRVIEGSIGAEKSSINGVIVGKDVGAVDAARLNGMVGLCVEHGVYVVTSTTAAHRLCRPMK